MIQRHGNADVNPNGKIILPYSFGLSVFKMVFSFPSPFLQTEYSPLYVLQSDNRFLIVHRDDLEIALPRLHQIQLCDGDLQIDILIP